ncbi:MAG: ABC transporter ATP-binding protein [Opitutales bacterium]
MPIKRFIPYFKYLKPVWWRFALGVLFGVVYSISSGLGLPLMAETVFPILFGSPDAAPEWLRVIVHTWFQDDIEGGFLIFCCLLLPFMMAVRSSSSVGNGYFITYSGIHVLQSLQVDIYKKVQSMPLAFFQKNKTGELQACISSYPNQIKAVVVDMSNDLVKQPLTLFFAIGFLIYKSFSNESFFVAIIGLVSIPLLVFPIRQIGRYVGKRSRQIVKSGEALNSSMIESLQSPLEIRAYNLENSQVERFVGYLRYILKYTMKSVRMNLLISPSIEFVSVCGISLSLFLGVRAGMGQGEFLALVIALYMAYTPIKKLGNIHGQLKALEAPLNRVEAILFEPSGIPEAVNPAQLPEKVRGEISFKNVSFAYVPDEPVLRNISLHIAAGESVGLVGKSGGGKSTFVNLIPRFYEVGEGSIELDGVDVRRLSLSDLRSVIGYVPQMPVLFNISVEENIRVGRPDASPEEIRAAAREANALEFIESLPDGFATVLSERGNSLSGGQRQRISIARAFLKDAPILILDEATSALDNESDQLIQDALARLTRDRTTLTIAHRMGTLKEVERRLYFESGRIVGDGSHKSLMVTCPGYARLVNSEPN